MNGIIQEGLGNNKFKPFWRYTKSKRQDNIGIAPLKEKGNLITDSLSKANNLVKQFQSVFTRFKDSILPETKIKNIQDINHLQVKQQRVFKIMNNLNNPKGNGPDNISNIILKVCAAELSPGMT